jgi:hypothetical protein
VASVSVIANARNEVMTYAVWAQDADTLLPETDLVALVADGGRSPIVFSFAHVAEVLGGVLESGTTYGFPPRFRVRRFPTLDEIEALGDSIAL